MPKHYWLPMHKSNHKINEELSKSSEQLVHNPGVPNKKSYHWNSIAWTWLFYKLTALTLKHFPRYLLNNEKWLLWVTLSYPQYIYLQLFYIFEIKSYFNQKTLNPMQRESTFQENLQVLVLLWVFQFKSVGPEKALYHVRERI